MMSAPIVQRNEQGFLFFRKTLEPDAHDLLGLLVAVGARRRDAAFPDFVCGFGFAAYSNAGTLSSNA